MCEDIGHPLDRRLVIGRTTSQDAGVAADANVIVATAALEEGFNDPQVGAVIQHKAPRGMASFLQRKGRAGRDRAMRPLTLLVLSDYGRDRALYQSYERLFDPELDPQYLPVGNPYVLKMQATFAFVDWLAAETAGYEKAWAWDILSRPIDQPSARATAVLQRMRDLLTRLVQSDDAAIASLWSHLIGALRVDEQTADGLLWEAPRSLLLEAVPMPEVVTIAAAWLLAGVAVFLIGAGPAKTTEWREPDGLTAPMQLVAFAIMVGAWPYVAWRWFVRRAYVDRKRW